mgnify:CR=1 FL=1
MNKYVFNYCLKNIKNENCFKTIYDFYYERLSIYITRKYNIRDMSEDIVQECFITLLNLKEVKFIEFYNTWLYKICDNLTLQALIKENSETQKAVDTLNSSEFAEDWSDKIYADDFGCFQEAINKLDKITKDIFYLYYVFAFTQKEIADILNISYANVRQKHRRGKKFLEKKEKVSQKAFLNLFIL